MLFGAALAVLPTIGLDRNEKGTVLATHPATTLVPIAVGVFLLGVSLAGLWLMLRGEAAAARLSAGLDFSRVKESGGTLSTVVADCEVSVVNGRIEDFGRRAHAVALPCNEYFDDRCVDDETSALGAYVNSTFRGSVPAFVALMREEAARCLGAGTPQRKTRDESAVSFGVGRSVLLLKPLGRSTAVAVVSTTTQRAEEGLSSRISFLFEGMRALVSQLADARLTEVVMPLMGAGHGRIDKPLALVGLLSAVAEVAHYGHGGQRLRKVTVVVFRADDRSLPEVDRVVVHRALALIGSPPNKEHGA